MKFIFVWCHLSRSPLTVPAKFKRNISFHLIVNEYINKFNNNTNAKYNMINNIM